MKRLALVLIFLLTASVAHGTEVDRYMTANTVSFNAVSTIVTFNSVTNSILLVNESTGSTVYVTYTGIGRTAKNDYVMPAIHPAYTTQSVVRLEAGDSVSIDISIDKIGFLSPNAHHDGNLKFIATGDKEQL